VAAVVEDDIVLARLCIDAGVSENQSPDTLIACDDVFNVVL